MRAEPGRICLMKIRSRISQRTVLSVVLMVGPALSSAGGCGSISDGGAPFVRSRVSGESAERGVASTRTVEVLDEVEDGQAGLLGRSKIPRSISSHSNVAMNHSQSALSQQSPTLPIDDRTPAA